MACFQKFTFAKQVAVAKYRILKERFAKTRSLHRYGADQGLGIPQQVFLQRKNGLCIYEDTACWYNVIDATKIVSSPTVIWLCRFPKHSNIEVGLKVAKLLAWFPFRNY